MSATALKRATQAKERICAGLERRDLLLPEQLQTFHVMEQSWRVSGDQGEGRRPVLIQESHAKAQAKQS